MLDVAWKVVYCKKSYPGPRQYRHNVSEVRDEHDKKQHVGFVKDVWDMP